ncbi:MAG: PKD domain-containing protein [Saprospiraceae bacterium]|nr:PKD domain-containing protein [Saprospiraceae bacterium]MBK7797056.1 PKD domain-containing protein [Saprospiraceae bacterium]
MKKSLIALFSLVFFCISYITEAQVSDYTVAGNVLTVTKNKVANYPILVTDLSTKKTETILTDRNGYYFYEAKPSASSISEYLFQVKDPCATTPQEFRYRPQKGLTNHDFIICDLAVNPAGCPVKFNYKVGVNNTVEFTATPPNKSGEYSWEFGDGSSGTGNPISHTYAAEGTYKVILVYKDSICTSSAILEVVIGSNRKPTSFNASCCAKIMIKSVAPTVSNTGLFFEFTASSDAKNAKITWDFGDGSPKEEGNPVRHKYDSVGRYLVTAYIESEFCKVAVSTWIQVIDSKNPNPCAIDFSARVNQLEASFTPTSSQKPDKVFWDFGDGTTSNDLQPVHVYSKEGIYKVKLVMVFGTQECIIVKEIQVGKNTGNPCGFDWYFKTDQLTLYAQGNFRQKPDSVLWSFGDSTYSKDLVVTHKYNSPGTYVVTLTVWINGVECSVQKKIEIKAGFQNPDIEITNINPNPATDNIDVTVKSDGQYKVVVAISDVRGNVLEKYSLELMPNENHIPINLDNISPGVYYLLIYYNNNIVAKSNFVKK